MELVMTNFLANGTEANISVSTLSTRNNITGYFVFPFLKGTQKVMLFDQNLKFDSVSKYNSAYTFSF